MFNTKKCYSSATSFNFCHFLEIFGPREPGNLKVENYPAAVIRPVTIELTPCRLCRLFQHDPYPSYNAQIPAARDMFDLPFAWGSSFQRENPYGQKF
jgi:hypothetical protein